MNKKILFSILLISVLILPFTALAKDLETMVKDAADAVEKIGVYLVVVGWIIAGILYLTSGGSPEKMGTAKKAITAAVIGTVLIAVAKLGFDAIKKLLKIE
jgi:hypothetical protein